MGLFSKKKKKRSKKKKAAAALAERQRIASEKKAQAALIASADEDLILEDKALTEEYRLLEQKSADESAGFLTLDAINQLKARANSAIATLVQALNQKKQELQLLDLNVFEKKNLQEKNAKEREFQLEILKAQLQANPQQANLATQIASNPLLSGSARFGTSLAVPQTEPVDGDLK